MPNHATCIVSQVVFERPLRDEVIKQVAFWVVECKEVSVGVPRHLSIFGLTLCYLWVNVSVRPGWILGPGCRLYLISVSMGSVFYIS
jgi:hypothetical protein